MSNAKQYEVTARAATFGIGTRLILSEEQAASREYALMPIKGGTYEATSPVQFKSGEVVGLIGDVDKGMLQFIAPHTPQKQEKSPKTGAGECEPLSLDAALMALNSENDDHWTKAGEPAMGIMQKLTGNKSLKREDIETAFPNFNRQTLKDRGASANSEPLSLEEALDELDPEDNDHWTKEGEPSLSKLQELTGDDTLTAEAVKDAFPEFNREAAK